MNSVDNHPEIYKSRMYVSLHDLVVEILDGAQSGDFVVFDIDDTVIHGHGPKTRPHPIGMTILREAKNRNIPVHYVTARPESPQNRLATYDDLERVGIMPHSTSVFMRPPHVDTWPKISIFKASSRQFLENKTGGNCLMTIGDQWTDILVFASEVSRDEMDMIFGRYYVLFRIPDKRQWGLKLKEPHM
jgi:hypothetical protein